MRQGRRPGGCAVGRQVWKRIQIQPAVRQCTTRPASAGLALFLPLRGRNKSTLPATMQMPSPRTRIWKQACLAAIPLLQPFGRRPPGRGGHSPCPSARRSGSPSPLAERRALHSQILFAVPSSPPPHPQKESSCCAGHARTSPALRPKSFCSSRPLQPTRPSLSIVSAERHAVPAGDAFEASPCAGMRFRQAGLSGSRPLESRQTPRNRSRFQAEAPAGRRRRIPPSWLTERPPFFRQGPVRR